jgi:hypothetical protein
MKGFGDNNNFFCEIQIKLDPGRKTVIDINVKGMSKKEFIQDTKLPGLSKDTPDVHFEIKKP